MASKTGEQGSRRDSGHRSNAVGALYKAIFEAALDAVFVADDSGNLTDVNPAACALTGYSRDELLGMSIPELRADHNEQEYHLRWKDFLSRGSGHIAARWVRKDRSIVHVEGMAAANVVPGVHVAIVRDDTERHLMEMELNKTASLLTDFVESASLGLHWLDRDGKVLWANRAFLDMLGYSSEEFLGTPFIDIIVDPSGAEESLSRLRDGEPLINFEARLKAKDGTIRDVLISSNAYMENDEFVHTRCFTRDVTEQKLTEQAQAHLAAIVQSSDDAIVSKDLNSLIQTWNSAAERIFGYTAEEAIGKSILLIFPPHLYDEEAEIIAKIVNGERVDHYETVRLRKDGRLVDVSVTISAVRNSKGDVIGASKIARDITDRKRADVEARFLSKAGDLLAESLEYRTTLSNIAHAAVPDFATWCAIDLVKDDGSLDRVAIAHAEPAKVKWAVELAKVYPTDMSSDRGLPQVLRTGRPELYSTIPEEMLLAAAKGDEHLRLIREAEIRSAIIVPLVKGGKVAGAISFISSNPGSYDERSLRTAADLARRAGLALDNAMLFSEVRELNDQLERRVAERTAELQAANRELEGFTYSVSHDLRGPLRAIMSTSMILQEDFADQLPDEARRELTRQAAAAKKLGDLIDDLLKLSRLARQEITRQHIDITSMAKELLADRLPASGESTVQEGMEAQGDPKLVRLLMQNIIENAIKFAAPEEAARIEVGRTGDGAFYVRDTGVGFDLEYADRIFMPFERLHREEDFPGSGIGLANVKRIAERHGGKAWAISEGPGQGATFFFTLGE